MVLDDTTAFPTLFLGAMRIGAVPVPVSPLDTLDNFRHYAEDSYAHVVVTDAPCCRACARRSTASTSATSCAARRESPSSTPALAAQDDELEPAPTHRDDMAFWLYSSGSTGKPKGVVHLQHDIEVTCETYARQVLGLREDDVDVLDHQALPRLRAGQRLVVPALVRRHLGAAWPGPTRPEPILANAARAPADGVLLGARRCTRRWCATPRRRRARLGAPVRLGRRGAAAAHLRPLAGALRPGDRRRHRLDRDAAHLLLQPAGRRQARDDGRGRCPGYELRITDEDGRDARRAGRRRPRGPRRLVRGLLLAPAREDEGLHARRLVHDRRPLRAPRGRRLRLRGPYGRDAQGRRAVGLPHRHGARDRRPPAGRGRRRGRRRCSTTPAASPPSSSAAASGSRRRSSPRSCARCARSACAATSTRTSCEFVDELPRTPSGKVQRFKLRELAAEAAERRLCRGARGGTRR